MIKSRFLERAPAPAMRQDQRGGATHVVVGDRRPTRERGNRSRSLVESDVGPQPVDAKLAAEAAYREKQFVIERDPAQPRTGGVIQRARAPSRWM